MKNKILQIVDVKGWAIDTLASAIIEHNPQIKWKQIAVHPKDLEQGKVNLESIKKDIAEADIIDIQYWRVCSQLLKMIPELKFKKIVLTHHNEKNLLSEDWTDVKVHVAKTKYSEKILEEAYPNAKIVYIPNSYDNEAYKFNNDYDYDKKVVGYIGRISPWKGLKEVIRACQELGYKLAIMGKHDKADYWAEIEAEFGESLVDIIDWSFFNCPNSDKLDFYKEISVYVGNSGPKHEVGTLGLIEAMATGIPVVSSPAGLVEDIGKHRENMMIFPYGNYDEMKQFIQEVVESKELRQELREKGWQTIKNYTNPKMAYAYGRLFYDLMFEDDLVSVVIPATFDRADQVNEILEALAKQTYKNIEALICWDEEDIGDATIRTLYETNNNFDFPILHLKTGRAGYNLAMARNLCVIDAKGEYLMFCDSRMRPEPNAVELMIKKLWEKQYEKVWVFGEKGGSKKTFVENFSMINRDKFIRAGMFNERINEYGGMSQELRERFAHQGFKFEYLPEAQATQMIRSGLSDKRDSIIRMKNIIYKLNL